MSFDDSITSDHKFNTGFKVNSIRMKPMERYGGNKINSTIETSIVPSGINSIMVRSNGVSNNIINLQERNFEESSINNDYLSNSSMTINYPK